MRTLFRCDNCHKLAFQEANPSPECDWMKCSTCNLAPSDMEMLWGPKTVVTEVIVKAVHVVPCPDAHCPNEPSC